MPSKIFFLSAMDISGARSIDFAWASRVSSDTFWCFKT
jgi:hypothetical protein